MNNNTTPLDCLTIEPKTPANASIIWLHGLGADANDFAPIAAPLQTLGDAHIRFIFPNAPERPITINEHMCMRAWYDIIHLDRLDDEDSIGIAQSQHDISLLIKNEQARGIDSKRIVLAGFSQGGAMALYTGLSYTAPLAGILALSCYLPAQQTFHTAATPANKNTPILQTHGEYDDVLPIQMGETTYHYLTEQNYVVDWRTYPMGHHTCPEEITDIKAWLFKIFN